MPPFLEKITNTLVKVKDTLAPVAQKVGTAVLGSLTGIPGTAFADAISRGLQNVDSIVGKTTPRIVIDSSKEIGKSLARFPLSAGEAAVRFPLEVAETVTGGKIKAPGAIEPQKIPGFSFLGEMESYQSEAIRREQAGEGAALTLGRSALNIALDEPIGFAIKPILLGLGVVGRQFLGDTVQTVIKDEARIARFGDNVAKTDSVDDIIKIVEKEFPGVDSVLAKNIAERYATKTDPVEIVDDFKKLITDEIAPSQYGQSLAKAFPEAAQAGETATHIIRRDAQVMAEVDEIFQKAIQEGFDDAERIAATQSSDTAVKLGQRLLQEYEDRLLKARAAGDKVSEQLARKQGDDLTARILMNEAGTEAGRLLRAHAILKQSDPSYMARVAQKIVKVENIKRAERGQKPIEGFTPDELSGITERYRNIRSIKDPYVQAVEMDKLAKDISKKVPTSLGTIIGTTIRAGLLTGFKTLGVITASNFFGGILQLAKNIPAVAIDSMLSLMTKSRTQTLTTSGLARGLKDGIKQAGRFWKTGYDPRRSGNVADMKYVNFGNGPIAQTLQRVVETIYKTIGVFDMPFYYTAQAHSIASQARAQAINEGLRGSAMVKRAREIMQDPPDSIAATAAHDAAIAVSMNETKIGKVGSTIRREFGLGGELLLPFTTSPSAFAMMLLEYSPVGALMALQKRIKAGRFDPKTQYEFSQTLGRSITGTGVAWLGIQLYKDGRVSLGYPQNEKEQKQWELEGITPNSIKIGDTWRSAIVLGPFGLALIYGGYFQKTLKETGSPTQAAVSALGGLAKSVTEQAYLRSINNLIETFNDPERNAMSFLSGFAGMFVPTLAADVARGVDGTERQTTNPLERIQSRVPFWRDQLAPRINVLGEEKKSPDFLTVMFDPTRPAKKSDSPVVEEFQRLWKEGHRPTPTQLGNKNGFTSLTKEQNTELWRYAGDLLHQKLQNVIERPEYRQLSDEDKVKLIENYTDTAYTYARAEIVRQDVDGLTGDALIERLLELKESKVLTKDAFKRLEKIMKLD